MSSKQKESVKRKRTNLSISDKLELLKKLEAGVSVAKLCEEYGVKKQTVSDIRKAKDKLRSYAVEFEVDPCKDGKGVVHYRKHMKVPKSKELEEAVYKWYGHQRSVHGNVRGKEIAYAANKLARNLGINSFKASDGWLWRFRNRHGIRNKVQHGEADSADINAVEPLRQKVNELQNTREALRKRQKRLEETEETRQARLLANRLRNSTARQFETEEKRQSRLLAARMRNAIARQCETEEERQARLSAKRTKTAAARQRETPEEHQARLFAERLKKRRKRQQINERHQNIMTHPMQMPIPTCAETQMQYFPVDGSIKKQVLIVDNHQRNIMSTMASFWRNGKFCDASIGNGKATVKVHKLVLYAACPKLVSLSKSDIESHEFLQVNLPDKVSWKALNAFGEYMYNGILDLDYEILEQLKIIADRLDMKEFEELCNNYLPNYMHQPTAHAVPTDIPLNHPSMQFPSIMSSLPSLSPTISAPVQSASSITTQVIDVKQEISERELVQVRKDTAAVFGQESEVASLTPNKSGNADSFVICPSVKTESVGPENNKYCYPSNNSNSQTFTITDSSSSSSSLTAPTAASTATTSVLASQTEFAIPFSEIKDVISTHNNNETFLLAYPSSSSSSLTAPTAAFTSNTSVPASQIEFAIPLSETTDVKSTKLKASHSYESTFVSDTSPVSFIVEKICSQSSHMTETISKPLSPLSNSLSVNLPTTSDKSFYPVRLFKSEADNLPP